MARSILITGLIGLAVAGAAGCSRSLPEPRYGPHTALDTPVEVPSPPPDTVQVEEVSASPDPRAVWVDGAWEWRTNRWSWKPGSWQLPPASGYYARPVLTRIPIGVYSAPVEGEAGKLIGYGMKLMFMRGHWHLPGGTANELPLPASSAR